MVWGVSRALQFLYSTALASGFGALLGPLNPARLLNKFRASDKDIEDIEAVGTAKNPKRQNTAIMFTDIVGYSAQMGKNEAAMVAKLQIHNEIMRNQIVRNRGTVIKTIGDAFMVRFRSAESAVQCALDCQKAIGEYNKSKSNPDDQFHIRIGVHMGEVIHTGTDVFGEGVNIAARIEPKADPDGIAVSDVIANAARNKVPAHFQSIGRLPMKNIANPPEWFKVFAIEQQQTAVKVQKSGRRRRTAAKPAAGSARKSRRHVQDLAAMPAHSSRCARLLRLIVLAVCLLRPIPPAPPTRLSSAPTGAPKPNTAVITKLWRKGSTPAPVST